MIRAERSWLTAGASRLSMQFWVEGRWLMMTHTMQSNPVRFNEIAKDLELVALQLSIQAPPALLYILCSKAQPTRLSLHYEDMLHNVHALYHQTLAVGEMVVGIEADVAHYEKFDILIRQADGSTCRRHFDGSGGTPAFLWEFFKQRGQEKLLADLPVDLADQVRQGRKK